VYLVGWRARSELEQGDWDAAEASAATVLDNPGAPHPSRVAPLTALGRLRARRGDPDPWPPLDEALELAEGMGELQRLAPVAAARAEARWLRGDGSEDVAAETDAVLALALQREDRWAAGELVTWRRRAGIADDVDPNDLAEPFRLELAGEWEAASRCWAEIGCPYEAALALADADDDAALRRAHSELQQLGARAAAAHVARTLRERGVRNVRHGPRAAARENPAGLTARELEVLKLVVEGLRNSQIAERLVISEKTVGHHVSAILRKLGVGSRTEASAAAARLGIFEK
jgi:DNA-binding CsgD family transcriptional regulator